MRIYAQTGDQGDALVDRIRSMTKEVEVGDEFTGKVVKTTTFGAFIELAKGTDGLLHISNIKPGERVNTVEDVLNRGDELEVKVVEVDRERGRIGLRLADDPEIAGKSPEELASMGTGDKGPVATAATAAAVATAATGTGAPRRPRPRRPRERTLATQPGAREPAHLMPDAGQLNDARLGRPGRDRGDALGALDRARVLGPHRLP